MKDTNVMVSIVIPCYNQGHFIQDALDSITKEDVLYPIEVIIVNDGSTDEISITKFNELSDKGYRVIHQENLGLSAARNTGIEQAKGKYILPLDADNKISAAYINKSIPILEKGIYNIVYANPAFIGKTENKARKYKAKPFDIYELIGHNYIDACAVYARDVWVKNGGYDCKLPSKGREDWEFWIHAYIKGARFYFINEKLFYYRIVDNSMAEKFSSNKQYVQDHQYIASKHSAFFLEQLTRLSYIKRKYDIDIKRFIIAPFIFIGYFLKFIKPPAQKAEERFTYYRDK